MEQENVIEGNVYGDVCYRKIRKKRQKALVQEMMYDYATNTTLHGLPYTTRRGFSVVEKVFWLITFISSVCSCIYFISNIWIKWTTSPVIVTISETLVPVGEVPFPSVTICPQLKIKRSIYDYSDAESKLDEMLNDPWEAIFENFDAFVKFDDVSNVCKDRRMFQKLGGDSPVHLFVNFFQMFEYNNTAIPHIVSVAPKKEDIFVSCVWRNHTDDNCMETMTEVITREGLCYNVNSLAAHEILSEDSSSFYFKAVIEKNDWSITDGYTSFGPDVYPVAGKAFGASADLEIIFRDNLTEHGQGCNSVNHGFNKIYIHHPADLPQSSLYFFAVRNEEMSSLALSFSKIKTSETAQKYSTEIRQCYFPEDFKLKYFEIYTASNCMLECLTNITYELCGCVGFYMPHQNDTETCTFLNSDCMRDARETFVMSEARKDNKSCRCLPSCYAIDYQAEILKTPFDFERFVHHYNLTDDKNISYSKLEVFYKGPRFVSMYRSEMFGPTDLVANIGGLLSLFLGFSLLSLVELVYYLTLRLFCVLKKDLKQEKKVRMSMKVSQKDKY